MTLLCFVLHECTGGSPELCQHITLSVYLHCMFPKDYAQALLMLDRFVFPMLFCIMCEILTTTYCICVAKGMNIHTQLVVATIAEHLTSAGSCCTYLSIVHEFEVCALTDSSRALTDSSRTH